MAQRVERSEPSDQLAVLSSVIEDIAEIALIADPEGRILCANRATARLRGGAAAELHTCSLDGLFRLTDEQRAALARCLRDGTPARFETCAAGESDAAPSVQLSISPLRSGSAVHALLVTGLDVTERRRSERALGESEERYRHVFDHAPIGIGLSAPDGKVVACNKAMEAITGYTLDDFTGMHLADTYESPAQRQELLAALRRDGSVANFPVRLKRKDGTVYDAVLYISRLHLARGEAFQTICIDVTDRKRAEEALRESEARYRAIVEVQTELVCRWKPGGALTFVNDAYCRFFGKEQEELVGHNFMPLIPEEDHEGVRSHFASITPESPVATHEHRVVAPGGEVRWQQWMNRAILDEHGRITEYQSVGRDITERKRAENELRRHREHLEELVEERTAELQEVNEELEAFAYSVSHDLRTPLQAMAGLAQALLGDYGRRLDAEGQECARAIVDAARRMDTLIRDLLAYSRVSRTEVELEPVRLDSVMAEVLMQLGTELREQQARLAIEEPLPCVVAHRATLAQAVANLVSNAAKFVAQGTRPAVRVRAEEIGDHVRLWVEDNGIGIAPQDHDRIFRVFERLHGADRYAGTGLGLAIVRKALDRMAGRVGVDSQLGKGSRFWIELPRAEPTG